VSKDTAIQWCDSTVNPVMGCDGCELWTRDRRTCYAGVLHERYGPTKGYARKFETPEEFPGRMAKAAKWSPLQMHPRPGKPWLDGLPRLVFVSDMGDALSAGIGFDYLLREVVEVARSPMGRRHRWIWLSKRPTRMREFYLWMLERGIAWPMNLWPMTSVTGRRTMLRASALKDIGPPGVVRGISFEPLEGAPDWDFCLGPREEGPAGEVVQRPVAWAIFGGEFGQNPQTTPMGPFRAGVAACRVHGVAAFVKQLGARPIGLSIEGRLADSHGGDWSEWPADLRVREMPREASR